MSNMIDQNDCLFPFCSSPTPPPLSFLSNNHFSVHDKIVMMGEILLPTCFLSDTVLNPVWGCPAKQMPLMEAVFLSMVYSGVEPTCFGGHLYTMLSLASSR